MPEVRRLPAVAARIAIRVLIASFFGIAAGSIFVARLPVIDTWTIVAFAVLLLSIGIVIVQTIYPGRFDCSQCGRGDWHPFN